MLLFATVNSQSDLGSMTMFCYWLSLLMDRGMADKNCLSTDIYLKLSKAKLFLLVSSQAY